MERNRNNELAALCLIAALCVLFLALCAGGGK